MSEVSIIIGNPKDGKSYAIKKDLKPFIGKSIGDKVRGEVIDIAGYEFEITGGSDNSGFPMRKDISGNRGKILVSGKTIGFKRKTHKGEKRRVTVAGRMIHEKTAQINLKVVKAGKKSLDEIFKAPEETKENAE